jgi:hypothetical protein
MGNPTYRAPVQSSNIHGNGEGLSGDVHLGSQCGIQKALIGPRVNEDPKRFGLVCPQQNDMKRGASGPPGWHSGLGHCIAALAVPAENLGSRPGSVAAGRDREVRGATHNWPSVVWVREGLAGGISLSHRAPATPVAGRAQCALTKVARCTVFRLTHWCCWLPGWRCAVLRSSAA